MAVAVRPPDPMTAAAAKIAGALIDPQVNAIQREAARKEAALAAARGGYANIIDAVGRLTAPIPGAISGAYQRAADATAGYASGLTGKIGDDATAAAAQVAQHLASLGAPGAVTSQLPPALNVANYVGGVLPAGDLAAEAASRLGEAQMARAGIGTVLGHLALAGIKASQQEIDELHAKGLDLRNTRPGEIQKALIQLRDEKRQQEALDMQAQGLSLQQWQALQQQAAVMTNLTGQLYTVHGGRIVPTGHAAPGSDAATAQLSAQNALLGAQHDAAVLAESTAHDQVMEGLQRSQIGISQQQADTASVRARAYARAQRLKKTTGSSATVPGMHESDVRQYGKDAGHAAYTLYYGQKNPKFDPSKGGGPGKDPEPGNPYYTTRPGTASEALQYMLSLQIPFQIIRQALYQYAIKPGSRWVDALDFFPTWINASPQRKATAARARAAAARRG